MSETTVMNANDLPPIPTYEWKIKNEGNLSIDIKAWWNGIRWNWNGYLNIMEEHSWFYKSEEFFFEFPFHGGVTYDRIHTISIRNASGVTDMKTAVFRKIGCDYMHLHDEPFSKMDPANGIPDKVMFDMLDVWDYCIALRRDAEDEEQC